MRVSALAILHNRVDLFIETIQSVLDQSYPVDEFIVVDDGSTEDVKGVIEAFNDPRIKYFYVERVGVISKLRNISVSKSTGDLLAFIDSDDLWHKDKIKRHVEAMQSRPCDISFSDCQLFNTDGNIGPSAAAVIHGKEVDIFKELTEKNLSLAFGTNLFCKRIIDGKLIQFDERLFVGEHDLIMMLCAKHKSIFIPQVLNFIRRHDRNVSKENSILDIIGPLEYNRTIDKLLAQKFISQTLFRKIKALNYSKIAGYYMIKGLYNKSMAYLFNSLKLHFRVYYLKILLKVLLLKMKS